MILFLFSFQSIQVPIDYYFDSSSSIIYFLYKNKIDSYNVESDFKLISSNEINNSNLYDLSKFKFINQHQLSSNFGGSVLNIKGDSIFRIDNSYEHKMQLGSLEFVRNDTLFRYGGYGFFENRNFFTFYDKQTNGWEFLDINGDVLPKQIFGYLHHFTKDKLFLFGGYELDKFKNNITYNNSTCYEFNFNSKKWKILGSLNHHFVRSKNSFSYDNQNLITFNKGKLYKVNYKSNLIESFFPNPIIKKIESSFFKPFVKKNQLYYFNVKDGQLELKSISLKNFEISLKKEDINSIYETSFWIYLIYSILIILFISILFFLAGKFWNKIIKIGEVYFYNLNKISLDGREEILFSILMNSSNSNSKVENRIITDLFEDKTLNYGTINRKKNESINKLNDKLKILLKTNKNIIIREYSDIDRREVNYFINPKFI